MTRSLTRLPSPAPAGHGGREIGLVATLLCLLAGCAGDRAPRGTVQGIVVDQNGRGLAGVALTLSGAAAAEMRTDSQGRYAFRRLGAGDYEVTLRDPPGVAVPSGGRHPVAVSGRRGTRADFAVLPLSLVRISDIQGRSHVSPFARKDVVSIPGIVTALRAPAGFYIQSPLPDASPETSEGLFVSVERMPDVAPGDLVLVDGRVEERPTAGAGPDDLSVTTLVLAGHHRLGRGFRLPEPVVMGEGDRLPPDRVICNDGDGDAERSRYDPAEDGLDFYESLEGMLVQVREPVVVGSMRAASGEFEVVGDGGRRSTAPTVRGGLALLEGDQNPERITVDLKGDPDVSAQQVQPLVVGDRFAGPIAGVLDYGGLAYKILPGGPLPHANKAFLARQAASRRPDDRTLACAALNLRGLAVGDSREQTADLAETIVKALHSPHLLALVGVHGDSGSADGGVVSWDKGARALLDAIRAAGGPATYRWREVTPVDNGGGGEPGANVRSGFLYDRERVQLVERMGGSSRTAVFVQYASGRPELSFSPGLVGLGDPAFASTPRPLAAEFLFRGHRLFVVAAHLASGSGYGPLFGRVQPQRTAGEALRLEQARSLQRFVAAILTRDRHADVIVLGSLGDAAWSASMLALKGQLLFDLAEQRLSPPERYTFVHRGNSVDLDHILVSRNLLDRTEAGLEIVHRYAEYLPEGRHDPVLASFGFR